ncbi:MAG TPA: hypothetical protein VJB13_01785 [Candidatus Nanoarchaeia archaeon]|nr:hypothetical protein [Candidatus Nanoarchaeia archaeon]
MEPTKPKLYFGHTVDLYGTPKELELVRCIEQEFPDYEVENPSQPVHEEGYQTYKRETGKGMDYYFQKVLPAMAGGVFQPFADGKFGAGVFGEAKFLHEQGKPIYEITLEGVVSTLELDASRALSVEETRKRVYKK